MRASGLQHMPRGGRAQHLMCAWLLCTLPASLGASGAAGAVPSVPEDDDSSALALAGESASGDSKSAFLAVEPAITGAQQRAGGFDSEKRLSFDFRDDVSVGGGWRTVIADRLDVDRFDGTREINTLKQLYASWQPLTDSLFEVGRINERQGVGLGYNPTDFFKANALRTVDSLDPDSLRDERLGTAMLRGEELWSNGALTALYAPRFSAAPSSGPFAADFGATNEQDRWLLTVTQRVGLGLTPQWILFGQRSQSPQAGLNVTSVLGDATVAFLEASAGRTQSQWAKSLDLPGARSLSARCSTGLTYSTSFKLSVSLEYEYDGAALGRAAWNAARGGDLENYGRYRSYVASQQELPTVHNVFAYFSWQDFLDRHLDLSGFVRIDAIDHSRLPWVELRYHWTRIDAALRWQDYLGGPTSDFGASGSGQTWQALLDYYL